jgi:uncharacterized membrane protein
MEYDFVGGKFAPALNPFGWRERLWWKLFPARLPVLPEAPYHWKDVIHVRTSSTLSWADRLRVLVLGRVVVETRIVTENTVGLQRSASVTYIR